jgi:hypothetical protein
MADALAADLSSSKWAAPLPDLAAFFAGVAFFVVVAFFAGVVFLAGVVFFAAVAFFAGFTFGDFVDFFTIVARN